MASPLQLANYVQQQGEIGRQRGTQSRLASLASQAYGAPVQERRGLVQQAIGADPTAGFALGQSLEQDRGQQMSSLSQKARMLVGYAKAGNQQGVQSLYPQLAAEAQQLGLGQGIPQQWDESFLPGIEQLAMMGSGNAGNTVHSQRVGDDGFIYNTMRDGSLVNTGVRADRQMWFRDHPGMAPHLVGKGGEVLPVGGQAQGAPAGGPGMATFTGPDGMPVRIGDDVPDHVRQSILANPQGWNDAPDGASAALPPAQGAQVAQAAPAAPNLITGVPVRPSEGQVAAQQRAAQHDTDLAYADALADANIPQGYRRTPDGNLEPIPGSKPWQEQQDSERQARLAQERQQRLGSVVVQDMDRALSILDSQPSLGGGTAGALTRVAKSRIPGTAEYAMRGHVESAKDTISLENLQGLKEASGAGLGNVSEKQTTLLSHAYGSIDLAADDQTLRDQLARTRNIYLDIVFGHGRGPERLPLSYQDRWVPEDDGWVDDRGRPLSTFGAADQRQDAPQGGGVDDLLNKYGVR